MDRPAIPRNCFFHLVALPAPLVALPRRLVALPVRACLHVGHPPRDARGAAHARTSRPRQRALVRSLALLPLSRSFAATNSPNPDRSRLGEYRLGQAFATQLSQGYAHMASHTYLRRSRSCNSYFPPALHRPELVPPWKSAASMYVHTPCQQPVGDEGRGSGVLSVKAGLCRVLYNDVGEFGRRPVGEDRDLGISVPSRVGSALPFPVNCRVCMELAGVATAEPPEATVRRGTVDRARWISVAGKSRKGA